MKRALTTFLAFVGLVASTHVFADPSKLTHQTLAEVVKVARAIKAVQPYLGEAKLMEYGLGLYRASLRYDIDVAVLIAIHQQETAFRENLPEGRAGEHGISQIRKMWLKQAAFKKHFGNPTIKDLHNPAKSFMMSAWILRDLKNRCSKGKSLPYWSYYNAVRFENRFKYYVAVNRNLAVLHRYQQSLEMNRQFAENTQSLNDAPSPRANAQLASPVGMPPAGKPRLFWTPPNTERDVARIN